MTTAFSSAHLRRYFKHLKDPGLQAKFKAAIGAVLENPQNGAAKTGDLSGLYTAKFSYKGTSYRLAYLPQDKEDAVVFLFAGTRENFYDELKRYLDS